MSPFQYRPAIDGLRTIAILAVFVFHLNHTWLPGGFVGVDIFFVISGYLITSIILRDCESGNFDLLRFYQRRIARIFPAFFTVALLTLLGAYLIYAPQDFASAGASLTAASLSVANIKLMFQGNYFEVSQDAVPYLHYWSLSVEEQFYMLFPVLFVFLFRRERKKMIWIMLALGLGSLLSSLVMTWWKPVWAFYLLPTRGWQLMAGCIIAVITAYRQEVHARRWYAYSPLFGLGLILFSLFMIHEGPHFPGWWAILPTMGAVAIIYPTDVSLGIVGRLLSNKWMVMFGRMSYSLYLWHWPVFCLVDYHMYMASESVRLILKVVISLTAAGLSLCLIENPARAFLNRYRARSFAYASLFVVMIACVILGVHVRSNNYVEVNTKEVAAGGLVYHAEANTGTVVLMGDSMGAMYGKMVKEVCYDLGQRLVVTCVPNGDALPEVTGQSSLLWEASLSLVKREKPDYLLLACAWTLHLPEREGRFDRAIELLSPHAKRIIVFGQPPVLPANATRSGIRNGVSPPFIEKAEGRANRFKLNYYLEKVVSNKVIVLDVNDLFQDSNGVISFTDRYGRQIYHEPFHLSGYGAEMVRPKLFEVLSESLPVSGSEKFD